MALLAAVVASAPAWAADMVLTCPAEKFLLAGNQTGEVTVTVTKDDPASMRLQGLLGEVTLPARIEEREGMVGASAYGTVKMTMPARAEVDACLEAERKKQPGAFEDGQNAYLALVCRGQASTTPEPVEVTLSVEVIVMEPPSAMATITRRYADEEGPAAENHGVEIIADCTLQP